MKMKKLNVSISKTFIILALFFSSLSLMISCSIAELEKSNLPRQIEDPFLNPNNPTLPQPYYLGHPYDDNTYHLPQPEYPNFNQNDQLPQPTYASLNTNKPFRTRPEYQPLNPSKPALPQIYYRGKSYNVRNEGGPYDYTTYPLPQPEYPNSKQNKHLPQAKYASLNPNKPLSNQPYQSLNPNKPALPQTYYPGKPYTTRNGRGPYVYSAYPPPPLEYSNLNQNKLLPQPKYAGLNPNKPLTTQPEYQPLKSKEPALP